MCMAELPEPPKLKPGEQERVSTKSYGPGPRVAYQEKSGPPRQEGIPQERSAAPRRQTAEEIVRAQRLANMVRQANGVPSFRKGGHVRKTGLYRLHAGERVVPKRGAGR